MLWTRSLLVVFFLFSSLQAERLVILDGSRAWYVAAGSSVAVEADRVIRLAGGPPSTPTPPPGDSTELTLLASTWPVKVTEYSQRNLHRLALASMYSTLSGQITAGRFDAMGQLQTVTRALITVVLDSDQDKWIPSWSGDIDSYLSANVDSLDEAAVAYLEIAEGLSGTERIGEGLVQIIKVLVESIGGDGGIDPGIITLVKLILGLMGGL